MSVLSSLNLPSVSSFTGVKNNNATLPGLNTLPMVFGTLNTVSKAKDAVANFPSMDELAQATKDKIPSLDEVGEKLKAGIPSMDSFTSLEGAATSLSQLSSQLNKLSSTGGLFSGLKSLLHTDLVGGKGYTANPGSFWDTTSGQPESPSYSSYYPPYARTYFYLDKSSLTTLRARGYSASVANSLIEEGFWEFISQAYTENHSEGHCIRNTQSDTYLMVATGANPISISLSGYLYTTPTSDTRIDFMEMYNTLLRGTRLADLNLVLNFVMKDTVMCLRITDISFGSVSSMSDMTSMTINGIGYKYKVRGTQWATIRQVTKPTLASKKVNAPLLKKVQDTKATAEAESTLMAQQNFTEMQSITESAPRTEVAESTTKLVSGFGIEA